MPRPGARSLVTVTDILLLQVLDTQCELLSVVRDLQQVRSTGLGMTSPGPVDLTEPARPAAPGAGGLTEPKPSR